MRIAINCRSILLGQLTGIGRYTYHLLDCLGKIDSTDEYVLHVPKRFFDFKRRLPDFARFQNYTRTIDYWQKGPGRCDIYHLPSPGQAGPYSGVLVVTVHDLIYKTHPQSHTPQTIALSEKYMQELLPKAAKLICASENTRRDLHRFYDISLENTCVIYNGVDHTIFYPISEEDKVHAVPQLQKAGIDRPFILYVGTLEPRKNLRGLLDAFAKLKSKKIFQGQLVVVGMEGWMMGNLGQMLKEKNIQEDVVFTGFVSDGSLRQLYNMAEVFVFPSFYEGFGFPIVEAFCCGVPVITSGTSACGEIAGNAALTIDPQDSGTIVNAMEKILTDRHLKDSLRWAGLKRAREFSFERTARETLAVYQSQASS